MVYIKKLVLRGFKSFPKEAEIIFDKSMNLIVGPNGSGKSNIIDSLCFVLGRLSIKSIRAAKSANLIFAGTKEHRPSNDASVKIIFDNTDKKFSLQENEIIIERIVRKDGQSIYKINNSVKTRQEVLELLAQADVDPYGFNIVLQGEIDSIIKMHPEERRKVIEQVAGISIYELRKEKSLRELEKTEEKLREVQTILRERAGNLKNLEEERRQALRYKKLQEDVERCKASIVKRKLDEKKKELSSFLEQKEAKEKEREKFRKKEQEIISSTEKLKEDIEKINLQIQKSSGIEQDKLNKEISDIRAELAGLEVRQENSKERLSKILSQKEKVDSEIKKISQGQEQSLGKSKKELNNYTERLEKLRAGREEQETEISICEAEISNLENIKKEVSKLDICPLCKTKITKEHVEHVFSDCDKKISNLSKKIEEKNQLVTEARKEIENLQIKIKELQESIPKIEIQEKELENLKIIEKENREEERELRNEIEEIEKEIEEKEKSLEKKEAEIALLEKRYHELINKKTEIEKGIYKANSELLEERNKLSLIETSINNLKIEIARLDAEKQSLEIDFEPYKEIKIISLPIYALEERLGKIQQILQNIGSVNMRALEVYDKIKEEYDKIAEKVNVLEKEKLEILKIIEEIDKKKKKTFMKTLTVINELFNRNFSQLYVKGQAFLELENTENPFSAGLDIVIKVAKGKYFDISSLSGGEKTLAALSLIFAIQEYKPYCFYIFDEVDATLDKRNSERLALLIKKYMKTGQYIIITHNDAIISEATILYGVSMQEGISKILSLEV